LCDFSVAPVLWAGLKRAFPDALGAVLMPNHGHLITPAESAVEARQRMVGVLSGTRRSAGGSHLRWEELAMPQEIPDSTKHLPRQLRYVWLNPSRDGLVDDPLSWLWSTYRDVHGAVVDPWTPAPRVAAALRRPLRGFEQWLHGYVSADPSVDVRGTPYPRPARPSSVPRISLGRIAAAASVAHRVAPDALTRRTDARATFLDLSRACGWKDARATAQMARMSRNAIWSRARVGMAPPPPAWLCLGDDRLLRPIGGERC